MDQRKGGKISKTGRDGQDVGEEKQSLLRRRSRDISPPMNETTQWKHSEKGQEVLVVTIRGSKRKNTKPKVAKIKRLHLRKISDG